MKQTLAAIAILFVLYGGAFTAAFVVLSHQTLTPLMPQAHAQVKSTSTVCTDVGLVGPALQENFLFCSNNMINNVTTDCCGSVYQQAIHLAQQKHIIVGTPTSVVQSVDWSAHPVAITYVTFTSGFHAEHFNPSNGIARIYDQYDRLVYSGT